MAGSPRLLRMVVFRFCLQAQAECQRGDRASFPSLPVRAAGGFPWFALPACRLEQAERQAA